MRQADVMSCSLVDQGIPRTCAFRASFYWLANQRKYAAMHLTSRWGLRYKSYEAASCRRTNFGISLGLTCLFAQRAAAILRGISHSRGPMICDDYRLFASDCDTWIRDTTPSFKTVQIVRATMVWLNHMQIQKDQSFSKSLVKLLTLLINCKKVFWMLCLMKCKAFSEVI